MGLLLREIGYKENEFTNAFFSDFLGEVTAATRDFVIARLSGIAEARVKENGVDTQFTLKGGNRPDVRVELVDGGDIFVEVKIRPEAYRAGQVTATVCQIAAEYPAAYYVLVDKTRVDFPELADERAAAAAAHPTIKTVHANWFEIYDALEERRGDFEYEPRDYRLIKKILEKMEALGMKPFKGLDEETAAYLRELREKPQRDFSRELDEDAEKILDEVEYLLYMRYADVPAFELKLNKTELWVKTFAADIADDLKPYVYCQWYKDKKFQTFVGLYKAKAESTGAVFPQRLFYPLALLFRGCNMELEMYGQKGGDILKPLDDWLKESSNVPSSNTEMWVGNHLKPEDFRGREIVEEIVKT